MDDIEHILYDYVQEFDKIRKEHNQGFLIFQNKENNQEKLELARKIANIFEGYDFIFSLDGNALIYKVKIKSNF